VASVSVCDLMVPLNHCAIELVSMFSTLETQK